MAVLTGFDDDSYGRDALGLGPSTAERRHEPAVVVTAHPDAGRGPIVALDDSSWLRKADLLVRGPRGHGPVRQVPLRSVSTRLSRGAACPLIVGPRTG